MSRSLGDLLIFGCGFLGLRAARLWISRGGAVRAITRSAARAERLRHDGIGPIVADLMDPGSIREPLADLPIQHVLYCVGYDRGSLVSKESLYIDGLKNAVEAVANPAARWVYVSSSSVYGQDDGSWVDETSPTEPISDGGRICLRAEQRLCGSSINATILRMSGLYGPERLLVRVDQLRNGDPIGGNPDAWLNLIHGDDAAAACVAALTATSPSRLYLVSDRCPIPRRQYYQTLARRVGAPEPRFSHLPTSRHNGIGLNKRCQANRILSELGLSWAYPTIAEGLSDANACSSED